MFYLPLHGFMTDSTTLNVVVYLQVVALVVAQQSPFDLPVLLVLLSGRLNL